MNIIHKLCECGCRKEVTINQCTNLPNRYISGHNRSNLGKKSSTESKERKRQYCLQKYGVDSVFKLKEIKEKIKKTHIKKYGVENPAQSEKIKEKSKQTCLKNYGVEWSQQSDEIQKKSKQTCIKKYGVEYPSQSEKIKEKSKQTCLNRWGVEYYSQTPQARIKYLERIEIQKLNGEPVMPCVGISERLCLNELQSIIHHNIIRNDHSVANIVGFFPDGHIPELKLFIEFDERAHFIDSDCLIYTQRDINRELILASLGYIVFRISEKNWDKNKTQLIEQLKNIVEIENNTHQTDKLERYLNGE